MHNIRKYHITAKVTVSIGKRGCWFSLVLVVVTL